MDPRSGELYVASDLHRLDPKVRERLVYVEGQEADIREIAAHVRRGTRGALRRAARKASKLSRRKNR